VQIEKRHIELIWGNGEELSPLAMACRALAMFFVILVLARLGGVRIFGSKSGLDNVVVIMLGAVAASGIVGASPFGSCVAACSALVAVHYLVARLQTYSARFEKLVSGAPVVLYRRPSILSDNLKKTIISEGDLMQSTRLETGQATLDGVDEAVLERNGRISFVRER
jgi:uncharacterized membrane protein YcaP (DUF421 family)